MHTVILLCSQRPDISKRRASIRSSIRSNNPSPPPPPPPPPPLAAWRPRGKGVGKHCNTSRLLCSRLKKTTSIYINPPSPIDAISMLVLARKKIQCYYIASAWRVESLFRSHRHPHGLADWAADSCQKAGNNCLGIRLGMNLQVSKGGCTEICSLFLSLHLSRFFLKKKTTFVFFFLKKKCRMRLIEAAKRSRPTDIISLGSGSSVCLSISVCTTSSSPARSM